MIEIEIFDALKSYSIYKNYSHYKLEKQIIKRLIFKTFPLEDKQWEDLIDKL